MTKLFYKWMLGTVILTLVIIGTLWVYQVAFLEKNYMETRYELIKSQVEGLTDAYAAEEEDLFESLAEEVYFGHNMTVEVLTNEGVAIYASTGRGHMMPPRMVRGAYLMSVMDLGEASTIITNQRFGSEILIFSKHLADQEKIISASMPLEPIKETIALLQKQIVWLSVFLLMVALVVGYFISRLFLLPISKLNYSVNELASGNMDVQVDIRSNDEFGRLADNFNQMAESLKKVDNLRKDLVANVSHELRTPLSIIKGYAELIRDVHGENAEKRTAYLNTIVEESDRLSHIVNNLLSLSQIQSGYQRIKKEEVLLNAFLKEMLQKHELLAQNQGIHLRFEGVSEHFIVNWDVQLMEQVFYNFLSNAIYHSAKEGEILIRMVPHEEVNRIEIVDRGKGMTKEVLEHVWERYYKGPDTAHKMGAGIGLAIVRGILKAHGYTHGATSALGYGSTFYFDVPKESLKD